MLDFGTDPSTESLKPPIMHPKLMNAVIKFKLTANCCTKVLLIDADHYQHLAL